jgi:hypothetical protein
VPLTVLYFDKVEELVTPQGVAIMGKENPYLFLAIS